MRGLAAEAAKVEDATDPKDLSGSGSKFASVPFWWGAYRIYVNALKYDIVGKSESRYAKNPAHALVSSMDLRSYAQPVDSLLLSTWGSNFVLSMTLAAPQGVLHGILEICSCTQSQSKTLQRCEGLPEIRAVGVCASAANCSTMFMRFVTLWQLALFLLWVLELALFATGEFFALLNAYDGSH